MFQRWDVTVAVCRLLLRRRDIPERRGRPSLVSRIRSMAFVASAIADADPPDIRYAVTTSLRARAGTGFENRIESSIEPNFS
ncbi:MAG: hypothetical protein EOO77_15135, partial [Oxalobacteraceae bacterium]